MLKGTFVLETNASIARTCDSKEEPSIVIWTTEIHLNLDCHIARPQKCGSLVLAAPSVVVIMPRIEKD